MTTTADQVEFQTTMATVPGEAKPPEGEHWQFVGFQAVGRIDGLDVVVVATWARPRKEPPESLRQRLLGEAVELLAPLVLAADKSLAGLTRQDGQRLVAALHQSSGELTQLVAAKVEELAAG